MSDPAAEATRFILLNLAGLWLLLVVILLAVHHRFLRGRQ